MMIPVIVVFPQRFPLQTLAFHVDDDSVFINLIKERRGGGTPTGGEVVDVGEEQAKEIRNALCMKYGIPDIVDLQKLRRVE